LGLSLVLLTAGATGAAAQPESLSVSLATLDSRNFPEVVAWLAVADANGPVEDLSAANFEVFEDNGQAAVNPLTVEARPIEKLRLVFAIDTSTTDAGLAEAKAAVINTLAGLGAADKAAILSFSDGVNLEYGFTNNTSALQAAVSRLSPNGQKTALNQAVVDAADMFAEFPDGRKAIVIITNSFDNLGSPTAEQTFARLQQTGTSLYVIGLGSKTQGSNPLKTQAALSGGSFVNLNYLDESQTVLQDVVKLMRKGYRISFESGLKADRLAHDLVVNVSTADTTGSIVGSFVATPGKIIITPRGLAANQTVKGTVKLAAEIVSPSQLATVSYLLDDQLLAQVSTPPFSFNWDTTATAPGNHMLIIIATDMANNEAQVGLNLVTAPPLQVTLTAMSDQIEIGDQTAVQVKIEAEAQVTRLDVLVNDQLLYSQTTPPFQFRLDNSDYPPGAYQISARVEDTLGRVAEDSMTVNFVAAPPAPPSEFERFLQSQRFRSGVLGVAATLAILSVFLLTVLMLIVLKRIYWNLSQRRTRLEIINLGNVKSRYSLGGRDRQGKLQFQFALNRSLLPQLSPLFAAGSGATTESVAAPLPAQQRPEANANGKTPAGSRNGASVKKQAPAVNAHYQTPFIAPNESMWVDLRIISEQPYKNETHSFEIVSQAIDQPNAPQVTGQGTVQTGGVFWLWRYLSYLMVVVMMGGLIVLLSSLAVWRLLAVDTTQLLSALW
jgi:VWFA-related protein